MKPAERAAFDSRFQHYDGYKSPARQDDLFRVFQSGMQYALASTDTDQLARVIHAWDVKDGPCDGPFDDLTDTQKDVWRSAALAVKNWLTGKDQQQ